MAAEGFRGVGRPGERRSRVAVVVLVLALSLTLLAARGLAGAPAPAARALAPAGIPVVPAALSSPTAAAPSIHIIIPQASWVNVTGSGAGAAPPATFGGTSAYDAADNETVYFGGCIDLNCSIVSDQTWVFAKGGWTNATNLQSVPPARDYASMDYDANMHGVLLFGGLGVKGDARNDTWLFHADLWTNVTSYSTPPPARYGAAMAFDPQPEENGSVLFGGYGPGTATGYLNDTWIWQGGAGWVPLTTSSFAPPELVYPSLAYDPASGYLVEFGGVQTSLADSSETWELYSGQWWQANPSSPPPGRSLAGLVYDPGLSGVVLFGGYSYSTGYQNNLTWLFSNGAWLGRSPSTSPPPTDSFGLSLDGTGTTPILVGGWNDSAGKVYDTTWAYEFGPAASVGSSVPAGEVGESVTFTASVIDGTAPYQVAFSFGDGGSGFASGTGSALAATHAFSAPGTYSVAVTVTDAVGAKETSLPESFTVTAGPAISAHASPSIGDVGLAVAFNSSVVKSGTAPLTYLWKFGDDGTATTANASHAYSTSGTYDVSVEATDADHATSTVTFVETIVADPSVSAAELPKSPDVGQYTAFFANVTGGSGPYTYTWLFGDHSHGSLPDPQHDYNATGSYTVEVYVNDSAGGSGHASITVTVGAAATPLLGPLSGAPLWFWGGVGALAAVGGAGSYLLLRRGRR